MKLKPLWVLVQREGLLMNGDWAPHQWLTAGLIPLFLTRAEARKHKESGQRVVKYVPEAK